jgi:Cu(I)/Ag(I) efflux system membrane fusion protein
MKNKNLLVFIVALFAFIIIPVACFNMFGNKSLLIFADTGKDIYYCPMHPSYTSDKPGDCPICNMKLVKREGKVVETANITGKVSEEKTLEQICIEHKCTMKDCGMHVKTNLKPGERVVCPICGEVIGTDTGKVVEIIQSPTKPLAEKKERKLLFYRNPMNPQATSPVPMKDSMGMDYVPVYEEQTESTGPSVMISAERQQLIGVKTEEIMKRNLTKVIRAFGKIAYDPELAVTQEEFIQALNNEENANNSKMQDVMDRAKSLTDASRRKLRLLGMSDDQITELEKTKKTQTNLYLPGKGESVWAYISIYEYEIGLVKVGASVEIEVTAYPGEVFSGKIVSVSPVLDPVTRTNQVRVEVENYGDKLKPEMFVNAKIKVDLGDKLAVPETAVLDTGLRKIVYLSEEGDILESREIQVGQKAEGYYEVLSGLESGDIVVTSGNFLVDSESRLQSYGK